MAEQVKEAATIEIDKLIADAILWTRFYAERANAAREEWSALPDSWAFADGRTKEAKAYKAAQKNYDRYMQQWRHWAERLGHRISNVACDNATLAKIENS